MSTGAAFIRPLQSTVRFMVGPWPIPAGLVVGYNVVGALLQNLIFKTLTVPDQCYLYCFRSPEWLTPGTYAQEPETFQPLLDPLAAALNVASGTAVSYLAFVLLARQSRGTYLPRSRAQYLGITAVIALVGAITRLLVYPPVPTGPSLVGWPSVSVRIWLASLIFFGTLGVTTRRYQQALESVTAALDQVSTQQRLVVEADERARREVAAFLHDQVQARLLVVAMQLRATSGEASDQRNRVLDEAIEELERIRGEDIRGAGRRLSPDLQAVGLDSALQDLADSWNAGMDVRIRFEGNALALVYADLPLEVLIATYRIIEQALLNAAAHGRATRVDVVIANSDSALDVLITDNGVGLGHVTPGTGSAFMDAWMAVVGGTWQLRSGDGRGAILTAMIPLPLI